MVVDLQALVAAHPDLGLVVAMKNVLRARPATTRRLRAMCGAHHVKLVPLLRSREPQRAPIVRKAPNKPAKARPVAKPVLIS